MGNSKYAVKIARSQDEIGQALGLRYKVFVEEENKSQLTSCYKIEMDAYDEICDHIIVTDLNADECVATCRLISGTKISEDIGFYSEGEFNLSKFKTDRDKEEILELGRVCINKDHRNGRVLKMLFTKICEYLVNNDYKYVMGCATIDIDDNYELSNTYKWMLEEGVVNLDYGISPNEENKIEMNLNVFVSEAEDNIFRSLPPLIRLYLKEGALVAGEPAKDPEFNCIDFLVIFETSNLIEKIKSRHPFTRF